MNLFKRTCLFILLAFPLQVVCMEADVAYEQLVKDIKALPYDLRVEIFKHKCAQICPQLIEEAQTLPELKELFKRFIVLDKDFRPSTLFQSTLFKLLEMKKYKILRDIEQQYIEQQYNTQAKADTTLFMFKYDIVNNGIDAQDKDQWSLLHETIRMGYKEIAECLVKNGANINIRNNAKETPLHGAAINEDTVIAELLIEKGADVNAQDIYKQTSLHRAVYYEHIKFVELLIKSGADLNLTNDENKTAFDCAKTRYSEAIIDLLKNSVRNIAFDKKSL